jgi:hypothetical protein
MANLLDTSYPPPDMLSAGDLNARCNNGPVEFGQTEKAPEEKPKDKKKKSKKR